MFILQTPHENIQKNIRSRFSVFFIDSFWFVFTSTPPFDIGAISEPSSPLLPSINEKKKKIETITIQVIKCLFVLAQTCTCSL